MGVRWAREWHCYGIRLPDAEDKRGHGRDSPSATNVPTLAHPARCALPLANSKMEADRFVARLFVENLGGFLDGKPLREVVNREAEY